MMAIQWSDMALVPVGQGRSLRAERQARATFPAVDITDDNAFEVLLEVLAGRVTG
jgi:hypothetical protein